VKGVQLRVGETRTVDAELQVGALSEQLQVEATALPLETSNARVGTVLEHQQLNEIPINGRNWATLEILAPGAINSEWRPAGHPVRRARTPCTDQ
jgi:hypothetical protein